MAKSTPQPHQDVRLYYVTAFDDVAEATAELFPDLFFCRSFSGCIYVAIPKGESKLYEQVSKVSDVFTKSLKREFYQPPRCDIGTS